MNGALVQRLRGELDRATSEPAAVFRWRRDARLMQLVRFHYENSDNGTYRRLLEEHGISSSAHLPITAEGLDTLPIVDKAVVRAGDYAGNPATPAEDVRFVVSTSGSTGNPMSVPQSFRFGRRAWGEMYARALLVAGHEDLLGEPAYFIAHYTDTLRSTGSFVGCTQMREVLGARAVVGNTSDPLARHLTVLFGHCPRYSCSAPGFYLALLAGAQAQGIDLRGAALEAVIAGGAPIGAENHTRVKDGLGLTTLRLGYVSSELGWIGVQIAEGGPYTIFADEYIVEVVDEQGRHVAPGERGRVLVTALSSDAAPLIRYANGDTARYLGYGGPYVNFPLLDEIGRDMLAIIGDGKVSYDDLAEMPRTMAELGTPVAAFQVAKQLAHDGRDQVHLRVELIDPAQDAERVGQAAIAAFRRHPHMDFHIGDGELPMPIVHTFAPGRLTTGRFKVPLYVDETVAVARAR